MLGKSSVATGLEITKSSKKGTGNPGIQSLSYTNQSYTNFRFQQEWKQYLLIHVGFLKELQCFIGQSPLFPSYYMELTEAATENCSKFLSHPLGLSKRSSLRGK